MDMTLGSNSKRQIPLENNKLDKSQEAGQTKQKQHNLVKTYKKQQITGLAEEIS